VRAPGQGQYVFNVDQSRVHDQARLDRLRLEHTLSVSVVQRRKRSPVDVRDDLEEAFRFDFENGRFLKIN
jgi:hypothetical protein